MMRIRKAVFPVAGLGTRFLPATKAMPKEMLPVVDQPLIQYVVDEAREAAFEHFIFVTGRNKHIIEDHFDRQFELECTLRDRQRLDVIDFLARELPRAGTTSFTRQQEPLGLGHAVWCARDLVGPEPFALLLPDVLIKHRPGCLTQMIQATGSLDMSANILAVQEAPNDQLHMYGVVGVRECRGKLLSLNTMVEKPAPTQAPSNLIITGRYILQPKIFDLLAKQRRGTGGEIQLTDAMIELARTQSFYGMKFNGKSFDCGSKIGFLAANVAYALDREDMASEVYHTLQELLEPVSFELKDDLGRSKTGLAAQDRARIDDSSQATECYKARIGSGHRRTGLDRNAYGGS
jgi:UTP--glucose-1-phosphate uridylyltransferase